MKHDLRMIRGGEMKFTTQVKGLALYKRIHTPLSLMGEQ